MKRSLLLLIVLFFAFANPARAAYEEYKIENKTDNPAKVFGRGLLNLVGLPLEISSTTVREVQMHPRLWPVTFLPRTVMNIFNRTVSGIHDLMIHPWYAAWSDDTSPWTDGLGLPRYPWQINP